MINFHVGQKVVCIQGATHKTSAVDDFRPMTGGIYTVRGYVIGSFPRLLLEEYVHPEIWSDGFEWGWNATRFRPLVSRKTDISIFTDILTTKKTRISA